MFKKIIFLVIFLLILSILILYFFKLNKQEKIVDEVKMEKTEKENNFEISSTPSHNENNTNLDIEENNNNESMENEFGDNEDYIHQHDNEKVKEMDIEEQFVTSYFTENGEEIKVRLDTTTNPGSVKVIFGDYQELYYYTNNKETKFMLYKTKDGSKSYADSGGEIKVDIFDGEVGVVTAKIK